MKSSISISISKDKDCDVFKKAVINGQWERATELYESMTEKELEQAAMVIPTLVKQFKNAYLRRVLENYPSLSVHTLNAKGQTSLLVAFNCANKEAALILHEFGANVLTVDKNENRNGIEQYAQWSRDDGMIELAREMLEQGNQPHQRRKQVLKGTQEPEYKPLPVVAGGRTTIPANELAAKFLARRAAKAAGNGAGVRVVDGIRHHDPDF